MILLDGEIQLVFHKLRDFVTGDGRSTLRQLYAGHLMGGGAQASIPAGKLEKILPDGQRYYLNWKHNLGQGARAVVEEDPAVTGPAVALALRAARLFGLRFASVDVIRCSEGLQVLEINPDVYKRQGSCTPGQTVKVLLPCPAGLALWIEDTKTVSQMEEGTEGIFMPVRYDETDVWKEGDGALQLSDLAEYGFLDGERYAFLEKEGKLIYADWAYPSLESSSGLEDVEVLIARQLAEG